MNHFTDDVTQNVNTQASSPDTSSTPSDVVTTKQQIEERIRRLTQKTTDQSAAPSSNFDALDYAKISSAPRTGEFGEADPYVNPVDPEVIESAATKNSPDAFPPAKTIEEILQKLSGYQSELESDEFTESNQPEPESEPLAGEMDRETQATGPAVEVIAESESTDSHYPDEHTLLETEWDLEPMNDLTQDDSPPVGWFSDSFTAVQENETTNEPENLSPEIDPKMAVPLVNAVTEDDSELGEAVFDVRDFRDSASGVIEPIPGVQEIEPEFFEFNVVEQFESAENTLPAGPGSQSDEFETKASNEIDRGGLAAEPKPIGELEKPQNAEDQLFVADDGDVIKIDGDDGFGYIDLACFDVQQATFQKQVIKIDAGEGSVFEIHHRNIPFAVFADGVQVDLTPDEPRG